MESAQERIIRLARLQISSTDKREITMRLTAEIAALNLDEVYASLVVLDSTPNSAPFIALRFLLLERMTTLSPYAALDYARQAFDGNRYAYSGMLLSTVFRRWAFSDPPAALQAWRTFMAGGPATDEYTLMRNRNYGLGDIFRQLGRKDLKLALAEMNSLSPAQQSEAWFSLSTLAGQEGPRQQLLTAIAALPPGEARTKALAETVEIWMRTPGQKGAAVEWLDSVQLTTAEKSRAEDRMAGFMGESRQENADWLIARAQSLEQRSQRLADIMLNWASEDPVAAGNWLKAQGLDTNASRAMSSYARTIAATYPEVAVEWARNIPDDAVRQRAFADVEKRIRQYYPHRADELLKPK